MKYIVYKTINIKNNKIYVGVHKTNDPNIFDGYFGCGVSIRNPYKLLHPSVPLHHAIKKYGFKNFERVTIQVFDTEKDALMLEAKIVDDAFIARKDTYNVCLGGGMPPNLSKKIYQYDLNGNFLNEYNSLEHASKCVKIATNTISHAVHNNSIAKEYYWSFVKTKKLDIKLYKKLQRKDLYLYDEFGNYVMHFRSYGEFCKKYNEKTWHVKRAILLKYKCRGFYLSNKKFSKFYKSN